MWNIHTAEIRTNNDSESFNTRWNRYVDKISPAFYEFVMHLRSTQSDMENTYAQVDVGIPPPPRKPRYVLKNERIVRYLARWRNPTPMDGVTNDVITTNRLLGILANMMKF